MRSKEQDMKKVSTIWTLTVLLALLALPALSEIQAIANPTGDLIIGNQVVLRIRNAAGGMTIQQRVDVITTRINKHLGSKDFDQNLITVRKSGNEYGVVYRDTLIVTADSQAAAYNKTSSENLANQWAANLKRVIPLAKADR